MDYPELGMGSSGEWVTYLQQMLGYVGHQVDGDDGQFGENTQSAVRAFQSSRGLPETGVADAATWGQLVPQTGDDAGEAAQTTSESEENPPQVEFVVGAHSIETVEVPEMDAEV